MLPDGAKPVVEFRHASWFDDEVYDVLRARGIAMCVGDYEGKAAQIIEGGRTPMVATAEFGYLRLREAEYDEAALRHWYGEIESRWSQAFVFFKHEETAPDSALALKTMAGAPDGGT